MRQIKLYFIFLLLFSCSDSSQESNGLLTYLATQNIVLKDNHVVVINSTDGCSGCVTLTAEFINKHIDKKNFTAIISSDSKKLVRIRYNNIMGNSNLLHDSLGVFSIAMVEGKPLLYAIQHEEIVAEYRITLQNADSIFSVIQLKLF